MTTWAITVPKHQADAFAALRLESGLSVLEQGETVWLQADKSDELVQRLWQLPIEHWFEVQPDRQLVERGCRVPQGWLPQGDWIPLANWLEVALPAAVAPGRLGRRAAWRLVTAEEFVEPNFLLASWQDWAEFGTRAPQARLKALSFAVNDRGEVAVHGKPLPPLRGERFVERERVAIPVGLQLDPKLSPTLIRQSLDMAPDELAILRRDHYELLGALTFVAATRSAIRASMERVHG